jgi:hypothetical protein
MRGGLRGASMVIGVTPAGLKLAATRLYLPRGVR